MRRHLLLLLLLPSLCFSQKFTVSGYVKDASTGESLIGAAILNRKTLQGTSANTHGFYSITLQSDSLRLAYSFVGYTPVELKLSLKRDTSIDVTLVSAITLDEVVVSGTRSDAIHETSQMGAVSIPIEQIKALPAILGQVDLLKTLQLMPGVKWSEGSTGLYVRGGGPDQNLMLLDGVPVYNASHLFGFFSVFNADAINRVELIKGGFPARYGGRLSSVIDINMKDGNMKKLHGEGSVDIVATKFTLEGPIKTDRTSFLVSGRRTYIDALTRPFLKKTNDYGAPGYYFYDLNGKINHIINRKNRIYLSAYTGSDKSYALSEDQKSGNGIDLSTTLSSNIRWGNIITAFRWNHIVGQKLFANVTTTYSRYRFRVESEKSEYDFKGGVPTEHTYRSLYFSGIRDWSAKVDFDYTPHPAHYIRFGAAGILHQFSPGANSYNIEDAPEITVGDAKINAREVSTYVEDDIKIGERLKVNVGGHFSAFNVENRWYHSAQPRVSGRFLLSPTFSLKASYASMMQYIHLLSNAGIGLPTDLWVPATAFVKPQTANQVALGLAKVYKTDYEISLEGYYKTMNNLIEYKDGSSFFDPQEDWEDKIARGGKGESYGVEILAQKKTGKVTGWVGYTLSWANRQFDEINNGNWYPYRYDRRHDASVAITHAWSKRMDFSAVWVYGTGNAITLPTGQYWGPGSSGSEVISGLTIQRYDERNSFRMRAYHRLDVSFSFWKDTKWGRSKWSFGAYNVYSRRNPYYIDLTWKPDKGRTFAEYSLFPIIPSVSWSFKF